MIRIRNHKFVFSAVAKIILTVILIVGITRCAKIAAPGGGARDEDPPVLKKSSPPNYSVQFTAKRITLEFDEYIQLKNLNQKLIISPPLAKRPMIRIKGKGLVIDIKEELKQNTTYSFNFGDAIADNNEGNVLNNFQYVVSTGLALDSLSIHGKVQNAFDLKIPEEVFVLMYDDLSDSAVFDKDPIYVTKINKNGFFQITNLKADTFHLYALADGNSNYHYDFPEPVAFISGQIQTSPEKDLPTLKNDSIVPADSLEGGYFLYLFEEKPREQYLKNPTRKSKENLMFEFNIPVTDTVRLTFLDDTLLKQPYIEERHVLKDTFEVWLTDTTLINKEVLKVVIDYPQEKEKSPERKKDTLRMRFTKPVKKRKKSTNPEEQTQKVLKPQFNAGTRTILDLNNNLVLQTGTPLRSADSTRWILKVIKDTLEQKEPFQWKNVRQQFRDILFLHDWKPDTQYKLILYPGAITDIYGTSNDTLETVFSTQKTDFYGRILLEMKQIEQPIIVQLLDDKEKVVRQKQIQHDTLLIFDYLSPQEFLIKAIEDENGDGKWTTGDLLQKRQPEKVAFYQENIKVRSNWDFKKTWSPEFHIKK